MGGVGQNVSNGPTGAMFEGPGTPQGTPSSNDRGATPEPARPQSQLNLMLAPPPLGFMYRVTQKCDGSGTLITCSPATENGQGPPPTATPTPAPLPAPAAAPPPVRDRAPPTPGSSSGSPRLNLRNAPSGSWGKDVLDMNGSSIGFHCQQERREPQQKNPVAAPPSKSELREASECQVDDEEDYLDLFGAGTSDSEAAAQGSTEKETRNEIPTFLTSVPPRESSCLRCLSPRASSRLHSETAPLAQHLPRSDAPRSSAPSQLENHTRPTQDCSTPQVWRTETLMAASGGVRSFQGERTQGDISSRQTTRKRRHSSPPSPDKQSGRKVLRAAGGSREERIGFHGAILAEVMGWGDLLHTYKVFKAINQKVDELHTRLQKEFPVCYERALTDSIITSKVAFVRRRQGLTSKIPRKRRYHSVPDAVVLREPILEYADNGREPLQEEDHRAGNPPVVRQDSTERKVQGCAGNCSVQTSNELQMNPNARSRQWWPEQFGGWLYHEL